MGGGIFRGRTVLQPRSSGVGDLGVKLGVMHSVDVIGVKFSWSANSSGVEIGMLMSCGWSTIAPGEAFVMVSDKLGAPSLRDEIIRSPYASLQ